MTGKLLNHLISFNLEDSGIDEKNQQIFDYFIPLNYF